METRLKHMWEIVTDHRHNFVVDEMPPLMDMPNPTFLGAFAWTTNTQRWISSHTAVYSQEGGVSTPSALARAYLTSKFGGKRRRCTTAQYQLLLLEQRTSPLFCNPVWGGEFVALDLVGAYWQILSRVGWDVDYFPAKWLGVKSDVRDFPYPKNKLMRNLLVSAGLKQNMQLWNGKKILSRKASNPHYNGILWACVQDVLNGVAEDMLAIGAHYVHTDGYILDYNTLPYAREILDEWGLEGTIRAQGEGWIKQVGRWRVGRTEVGRRDITKERTLHKVQVNPYKDWLKVRIKRLSS